VSELTIHKTWVNPQPEKAEIGDTWCGTIRTMTSENGATSVDDEVNCIVCFVNMAVNEPSKNDGQCYCIHPFMSLIDFTGATCGWCGQPIVPEAVSPAFKLIRTAATIAAFPHLVKPARPDPPAAPVGYGPEMGG
jgi:hypothetical protein